MTYDCIIVSGDSYSALHMHTKDMVYSDYISQRLDIPVFNIAKPGSSNDRIMRSLVEKTLEMLPRYKSILVLVALSFIRRREVWYYGNSENIFFRMPDVSPDPADWPKNLRLVTLDLLLKHNEATLEQKVLIDPTQIHKQLVDFYTNIFLTSQFLKNNNIDYRFFSGADNSDANINCFPAIENLQLVQAVIKDPKIFQLGNFSIQSWAKSNDPEHSPTTAHLSPQGHENFSKLVIERIIQNDIKSH